MTIFGWLMVIVSGFAWFGFVAVSLGGETSLLALNPGTTELILFGTQFGQLWIFRFACCFALELLFVTGSSDFVKAALALVILASLGAAGHAMANASGVGLLAVVGDIGHLVAASLWPGGLVPFASFLHADCRGAEGGDWNLVARVTARFSTVSLVAVAFLASTGILNTFFIVGNLRALFLTDYGQLLLVKIGLFLLTIGFGAYNLLVLKPRMIRLVVLERQGVPKPIKLLIRNVICESALACGVLLVVGFSA